ncbi:MAG TPA: pyruvate kinase [Flavobacteriales bacterium]|nr:pyruvate kinase [Flavobacteriales bacterium]
MSFNRTKIIATIGPASSSKEMLKEMINSGMSLARLNFSHGSHEDVLEIIKNVRELNDELGVNVGLLADLQGPKIRLGEVKDGGVPIKSGHQLTITTKKCIGDEKKVYLSYPEFPKDVAEGDTILINDGKLVLQVTGTDRKTEVTATIEHGGLMESRKGVNLPNTKISMPCLTAKDLEDLKVAVEQNVEWIGLSFVRRAEDVIELKNLIKEQGGKSKVVAKIEKPEAVKDLSNIISEADAVMVARGDLGVEIPMQEVPVVQKLIVKKCINESKPVIIATQMMESMITNPAPTRAEVNDVANAVLDGADALMLSGETSVGDHPELVIKAMYSIIRHLENKGDIYNRKVNPISSIDRTITDSICQASAALAWQADAKGIITMTNSGYTAFKISSYRPKADIFVFTDNRSILAMLSLVWGVRGFYYDKYVSTDHTIADLKLRLKREGMVKEGDLVINIASTPITERGQSNMMKLSVVS